MACPKGLCTTVTLFGLVALPCRRLLLQGMHLIVLQVNGLQHGHCRAVLGACKLALAMGMGFCLHVCNDRVNSCLSHVVLLVAM